jgi:hypothetical protein
MGWSEKYWEDVRSELEQSAPEPGAASEDEPLGKPAVGQSADILRNSRVKIAVTSALYPDVEKRRN